MEKSLIMTGSRPLRMTKEYLTIHQGAEASLSLTDSTSCGVPSSPRKLWTRHKKTPEYVRATNTAFQADYQ
uniref:Vexin n=1 Tax=Theropithecus gelada TaxID=9565 RepID=A0A8D2FZP7_THEGE